MFTPRLLSVRAGALAAAPLLLLAACGGGTGYGGSSSAGSGTSSTPASSGPVSLSSHHGSQGTFLTDASGRTVYLFVADHGSTSTCSGACAQAWPPLTTSGKPQATGAVKTADLGTTSRSDGSTQVTYAGHPLYYYIGDTAPGQTTGEGSTGFGALWWMLSPTGSAITSGSTGGSGSSGSGYVRGGY